MWREVCTVPMMLLAQNIACTDAPKCAQLILC